MKTNIYFCVLVTMIVSSVWLTQSCREKTGDNGPVVQRGNPVLRCDTPIYDESTQTFSLTIHADSIGGASVSYELLDGDSVIVSTEDGQFTGILPFEEGYNVRMLAQWEDTTIERVIHVMDFVIPREPVEKLSAKELEQLINNCDKSLRRSKNEHLSQGVKLVVNGSKIVPPQMIPDVITLIENNIWQRVEVTTVEYDDNNLIRLVKLKPIGEEVDMDDDEDVDY